jgi:glucosamine-6-phosphate deaminase
MRLLIVDDVSCISEWIAKAFRDRLIEFEPSEGIHFVVGLPVGSSAAIVYNKLIDYYNKGEISFKYVSAFVIDEYVGLYRNHPSTQHSRMWRDLFSKVDIAPENVHILDGNADDWLAECTAYEEKITAAGGVDFMFMGSGSDGHVARNEPGSSSTSRTRVKTLAYKTVQELKPYFQRSSKDNYFGGVPTKCLTMGLGTLHEAREMIIMFSGKPQAVCLSAAIEKGVNHMWPVSSFQSHKNCTFICDENATSELKVKTVHYFKGLLSNYQLSTLGPILDDTQTLSSRHTELNHHLTPLHARNSTPAHNRHTEEGGSSLASMRQLPPTGAADLDGLPMGPFKSPGAKLKEQKIEDLKRRRAIMGASVEGANGEKSTESREGTAGTAEGADSKEGEAEAGEAKAADSGAGGGVKRRGGTRSNKAAAATTTAVPKCSAKSAAGSAKKKARLQTAGKK